MERAGARRGAPVAISSPPSTTPMAPHSRLKRFYNSVMAKGERVIAISRLRRRVCGGRSMACRSDRLRVIPPRRRRHSFRSRARQRRAHHRAVERMAPARRRARGHAAGSADALEGPSGPDRSDWRCSSRPRPALPAGRQRRASAIAASWIAPSRSSADCGRAVPDHRGLPRHAGGLHAGRRRRFRLDVGPKASAASSSRRRRWAGR